jgi:hypothetical protein
MALSRWQRHANDERQILQELLDEEKETLRVKEELVDWNRYPRILLVGIDVRFEPFR